MSPHLHHAITRMSLMSATMPPLSPLDELYADRFHAVTNLWREEKYEEAYAACRK